MATSEKAMQTAQAGGSSPAVRSYAGSVTEALTELVEGLARQLGADIAALLMADDRVRIRHAGNDRASNNRRRLMNEIEARLSEWMRVARAPMVVNEPETDPGYRDRLSIACKLVIAPIELTSGVVSGIVVLGNPPSAPDFTSKTKLAAASAAARAAGIIKTRFDASTGLMTRREFESVLDDALSHGNRSTTRHCLLHVDIDELHKVEDALGVDARDEAIAHVARQLAAGAGPSSALGRVGPDEFAILLRDCTFEKGFCIGQELRRAVGALNVVWRNEPIKLTASIGVTQLIPEIGTRESTLAAAKIACITAKELGRDQVKSFRHSDAIRLNDGGRTKILTRIQDALQNDRFVLFGQVIRPLSTRARAGHVEVLLKGIDDENEPLEPSEFIPFAERGNIMPEIDRWVVRNTLEKIASFQLRENRTKTIFAINLSGQSLCDDGFLDFVTSELERTAVAPRTICFEITETAAILNIDRATHFMTTLREHGCLFSLDDFGAGLSSFSYLRVLPVSYLKIDGQFVRDIVGDPICEAIVAAISQMSDAMGLKTIAEFVETVAIKQQVRRLGIDYAQGNAVAETRPLDTVFAELARGQR